jgi:hypothetical protein
MLYLNKLGTDGIRSACVGASRSSEGFPLKMDGLGQTLARHVRARKSPPNLSPSELLDHRIIALPLRNFTASPTHVNLPLKVSAIQNVKVAERINALHSYRSMGAHKTRRAGNDAPVRGSSTEE